MQGNSRGNCGFNSCRESASFLSTASRRAGAVDFERIAGHTDRISFSLLFFLDRISRVHTEKKLSFKAGVQLL